MDDDRINQRRIVAISGLLTRRDTGHMRSASSGVSHARHTATLGSPPGASQVRLYRMMRPAAFIASRPSTMPLCLVGSIVSPLPVCLRRSAEETTAASGVRSRMRRRSAGPRCGGELPTVSLPCEPAHTGCRTRMRIFAYADGRLFLPCSAVGRLAPAPPREPGYFSKNEPSARGSCRRGQANAIKRCRNPRRTGAHFSASTPLARCPLSLSSSK